MVEDNCSRVSSVEAATSSDSSTAKQRKKRKWDQPAESLVSVGLAVPGIVPVGNMGSLAGVTLPGIALVPGAPNFLAASSAIIPQVFQAPLIQPLTTAVVAKPKIQDELIAREIVINDADSLIRYKLTKRQTQEEIQRCTGAVVITRGTYRPPNAPHDAERPLYLHISAGAHLETTVERIKAVDRAAAMVEEMLKHGSVGSGGKVSQPLSTCVYLGFEADPCLNIVARIRGPNDQYVNHIMNETGATVVLRGRGSGNSEVASGEEGQQPLHLFLSSNNQKSLESAKLLAENLLDTIIREFGASRVSSSKVYGAVPPPQQLLAGGHDSGNEVITNDNSSSGLTPSTVNCSTLAPVSSVTQSVGLKNGFPQPLIASYPQHSLTGGTSYSGYGGIYPQATPLQQVALALRQSPSLVSSTAGPATAVAMTAKSNESLFSEKEKRPPQKRKFQELPVALKEHGSLYQDLLQGSSEFLRQSEPTGGVGVSNISTMPPPKKLVQQSSNGMPSLPPGTMPPPRVMPPPPPPPPPKFNSSPPTQRVRVSNHVLNKSKSVCVPDTLVKLVEYGDEDDDDLDESTEISKNNSNGLVAPKPFWAV